jgi:capsule polysaccharide export protein KpsE/RkpR
MQLKGENSPLVNNITIEVEEYERKIREIKNTGSPEGMIPPLDALPEKGINYFRLLREIEINSKILEFILPFYEQAKIEEKKDIPTLQIIDKAIPPEKKSYPPRTIITLVITFGVFIITFFFILIRENQNWQQSEKFLYIRTNLFRWKDIS